MQFVMWTDQWPLTRHVYHNLWHMRRAAKLGFSEADLYEVVKAVASGFKSIAELNSRNLSFDVVHASAQRGLVFINIFHPINANTKIYQNAPDYMCRYVFEGWSRADLAWCNLQNC
jgi:hypothetical protein